MPNSAASSPPDYYEVLQVSPKADPEVIQAAYQRLVEKWQAERRPGDPSAFGRLTLLDQAHAAISDPLRRTEYDDLRRQSASVRGPEKAMPPAQAELHHEASFRGREQHDRNHIKSSAGALDARERVDTQPAASEVRPSKPPVGPGVWATFAVGTVLFLLSQSLDLPAFLARVAVWGLIFGVPAWFCLRHRKRKGLLTVTSMFMLAAAFDVAVGLYIERTTRSPRVLPGASPGVKTVSTSKLEYERLEREAGRAK